MKVSKNWISDYVDFELPEAGELVSRIGAQLGGVEHSSDLGPKYSGVIVAKVVECSPLENSDHLHLCFIDDAGTVQDIDRREDGLVQVVCGAPNVTAGATVAWLPPGSTVPSTFDTEPFILEARALRGTISNGMLASAKELAVGESHEGLLLLDNDLAAGTSFSEAYKLNDVIIDVENKMFTHRPDCFGQLGIAREVAGIFGRQFTSPDWYMAEAPMITGNGLTLSAHNEATNDVPRFMTLALKNVSVAPSPIWMQSYLSRVGIRPINNLVDITNYIMMLTGQPTHAYDYDKVADLTDAEGAVLTARYSQPDETIELLSGKVVTPRSGAIVIATDRQAIGLAGVMGGANTEVDENTTNIILECASFDMYSIRRTSMAHGLFTDAVTRFNKGQSALQNPVIMGKAVELFQQLAGAEVASDCIDIANVADAQPEVVVDVSFINARLGVELAAGEMAQLLTNVEFQVSVADQTLTIKSPFWRTDIEQAEDIVEEVGRLYGFDKLPLDLPGRTTMPADINDMLRQKTTIRDSLVAAGANELLTYSFVHGDVLDKVGQDRQHAFKLSNALSPDLQYFRFHALPSLLDKVHPNIKAGYDSFALFELNKGHTTTLMDDGLPVEVEMLDLVIASKQNLEGAAYYQARRYLDVLANDHGIKLRYEPLNDQITSSPSAAAYAPQRSAMVYSGTILLGIIGEFKMSIHKKLKLPSYCAGFSIDQSHFLQASSLSVDSYRPLPRFPKIEQDICLKTTGSVAYNELHGLVEKVLLEHKPENSLLAISPLDIYQKDVSYKQTTFRVGLANYDKTMTDAEMTSLLEAVTERAALELGAERV